MRVIAVAQQKGGVGKSTLVVNLAIEAMRLKKQVCILDLDSQGSCMTWRENRDARMGEDEPPPVIRSDLRDLEADLESLEPEGYDYVFLDLPGRRSADVNTGVRAADFTIIPTRPSEADYAPSLETASTARRVKTPYVYVLNLANPKKAASKQFMDMIKATGHPVAATMIGNRPAFESVIDEGIGVGESGPGKPAATEIGTLWKYIAKEAA